MFAYSTAMSLDNIELIFSWYLIYFLIIKVVNNEKRFFIFLLLYFLFNFKMSQHGFISWATNGFSFRTWGATGAPGWFHNSGEFGIEMCIFIPLLICFMASIRKNINNLRYAILIIVLITALGSIVASSSRGAVLGLAAMGIYAILKSKLSIKVVLAISLISIVSIYFMPAEFIQRFIEMGEDKSSVSRLTYWKAGIDMLKDNPVFGIGYNNWMLYYEKYYAIGGRVQLPHNVFIQAASELGLAGLFGFVLMIIYSLIINMRTRKISILNSNNFIYWMSHGFDIALVGMLTSGFFVTVLYYPFFWIYISFVVALNNVATKDNVVAEVA
ncbi:MAG: O-antigen ligase family protein [Gammaproteobacteria bacterium]|nr:O-antigen ligase family protein [Gammaproteobacteria bacterium]